MPKLAAQVKENQETQAVENVSNMSWKQSNLPVAANDPLLQEELEKRYGAAFAQWIMDDLRRASIL